MTPTQLMATGQWTRSGEWPEFKGTGPLYRHRTLDVRLQGYATHRNSRRGKGITKMRLWVLSVNGKPVWEDTSFKLLADAAAEYGTNRNSATGQCLNVNTLTETEAAR